MTINKSWLAMLRPVRSLKIRPTTLDEKKIKAEFERLKREELR